MVSTLHDANNTVARVRKKPRLTSTNRRNIDTVWGNQSKVVVETPKVIDDCNHWMLGVDKADQLIAHCWPNVRCRRIWMPIMFHALDLMRINAFIIYNSNAQKKIEHKDFVLAWVDKLIERATTTSHARTQSQHERSESVSPLTTPPPKKRRISHSVPLLSPSRLVGGSNEHKATHSQTRSTCKYCSYLCVLHKVKGYETPAPKKANVKRMCSKCNVYLCKDHFDLYHTGEEEDCVEADGSVAV